MQQKFEQLKKNFHEAMEQVKEITHLEEIQQTFLSRKGSLAELMKSLKEVAENERKEFGQIANRLKQEMEALFEETRKRMVGHDASRFLAQRRTFASREPCDCRNYRYFCTHWIYPRSNGGY